MRNQALRGLVRRKEGTRRTPVRALWTLLKEAGTSWSNHKDSRLGAALACYSIVSIVPLIVIVISIAGLVFGADAVRQDIGVQLKGLLGDSGAKALEGMLEGASKPTEGIFATVFGAVTLIFAALGVVVQLKDALNTVWEVEPSGKSGVWNFIRTYLVSLAGVLSLGFLLLISLLLTTALAAGAKYIGTWLPESLLQIASMAISFGVITLLFAMMFKWLPDAQVAWRDVWLGAVFTALLFEIGKFLIGFYIGKQGLESTYGAAASLVVLLIWVYYSSQIVLLGAEFTRAYAKRHGSLRKDAVAREPKAAPAALGPRVPAVASGHPVQLAVRHTPYAAAVLAILAGWLLGRARG